LSLTRLLMLVMDCSWKKPVHVVILQLFLWGESCSVADGIRG